MTSKRLHITNLIYPLFQSSIGARITVMQTILPTVGPGALQNREDATHKASKVSKGRVSFCGIL